MKCNIYALYVAFFVLLLTAACSLDNKIEITNLMHTDMREDSDCIKKTGIHIIEMNIALEAK